MSSLAIRKEKPEDHEAIYTITEAAFHGMPYAGGDEQDLVNQLRDSGALTLSLVAEKQGAIIGHVAFSLAKLSDSDQLWYALGPVSVTPSEQGQGIGAKLIQNGLKQIQDKGALGCILTGNPLYYKKFGFVLSPNNVPKNESATYFMVKTFIDINPMGIFKFDKAFYAEQ